MHGVADNGDRFGCVERQSEGQVPPCQLGGSEHADAVFLGRGQAHGRSLDRRDDREHLVSVSLELGRADAGDGREIRPILR